MGLSLDQEQDRALVRDLRKHFPGGKRHRLGDGHHLFFEQIRRRFDSSEAHLKRAALFGFVGLLYEIIGGEVGTSPGNAAVEESLRLIQSGVSRGIGLDEVASELGLSKSYLVRLFKKHMGVSPMKYANNLRMEVAAELLKKSDVVISEVAQMVGFSDEYQFNKRFKQWSGKPPGRFRRDSRG
jgi:AraC-like DNA-binding protein